MERKMQFDIIKVSDPAHGRIPADKEYYFHSFTGNKRKEAQFTLGTLAAFEIPFVDGERDFKAVQNTVDALTKRGYEAVVCLQERMIPSRRASFQRWVDRVACDIDDERVTINDAFDFFESQFQQDKTHAIVSYSARLMEAQALEAELDRFTMQDAYLKSDYYDMYSWLHAEVETLTDRAFSALSSAGSGGGVHGSAFENVADICKAVAARRALSLFKAWVKHYEYTRHTAERNDELYGPETE